MAYALVSGGSKGIGLAIATSLARRKYNLVLVARNLTGLESAKKSLQAQYPIQVELLQFDLGQENAVEQIAQYCIEKDLPLQVLCNVVGIGGAKDYLSSCLRDNRYMLRLNTEPAIGLTFNLLELLKKNTPAYILNVSSIAGFAPIPVKNIYSASKSAIIFFSYSLKQQLKMFNISVSCLCPGPVFSTPEIEQETIKKLGWFGRQMAVPLHLVGEKAVRGTLQRKMLIIPGKITHAISILLRLFPPHISSWIYYHFDATSKWHRQ